MSTKQGSATTATPASLKDESRDNRLSFRKFGEHQLRREFKDMAIDKCKSPIQEFGKCATESGLLVVWKCRAFNKKVQECMAIHNSQQEFEKFKTENQDLLLKKTPGMNKIE